MDRILRINVGAPGGPAAAYEPLGKHAGLGGCALAVTIAGEEIPESCHALGPENKVILAPGLLCGSPAAAADRLSVCSKSPLTQKLKIANSTAEAAGCMARLGIAAIVLEGTPVSDDLFLVYIEGDEVSVAAASELRMRTNHQVIESLRTAYGDSIAVVSIGTGGEMRMASSTIAFTDSELRPNRHAGRGGTGAVMGSKGIKAVVLNAAAAPERVPANPGLFQTAYTAFSSALRKHPVVGEKRLTYGTGALRRGFAAGQPNVRRSAFCGTTALTDVFRIDQAASSTRQSLFSQTCRCETLSTCSCLYPDLENRLPASEAIWAHGGACGVPDKESANTLAFLADSYGLDALELCAALSLLMEAGQLRHGDFEGAVRLVRETGKGTPLGRLIGAGAASVAKAYGLKAAPDAHKYALPLYEACLRESSSSKAASIRPSVKGMSVLPGAGLVETGRGGNTRDHAAAAAAMDALGCCLSLAFVVLDRADIFRSLVALVNGFCGTSLTTASLLELGYLVLESEQQFNRKSCSKAHQSRVDRTVAPEPPDSGNRQGAVSVS